MILDYIDWRREATPREWLWAETVERPITGRDWPGSPSAWVGYLCHSRWF